MESIHDLANYYDWVSKPKATFMGLSTEIREMIYHECYPENEIKIAWKYDRYNPRPHRDWRWWPAAFPLMLVNRKIRAEILNAIPITVRFQCNGNLSLEFIPKDLRDNMNSLYCNAIDFYDIMREDPFDNLPKLRYVSFKGDINIDRDVMVESGTNGIPILESPIPSESRPDFALLLPRRVTMDESTMADVWAHQICEPNKTLQFTCAVGPFHFTGMNDRPAPHRLATIQVTAVSLLNPLLHSLDAS